MDSLVDALPDAGDGGPGVDARQAAVIKQKSLKHRPGAMKRKAKLDQLERDRFAKNMAQMTAGLGSSSQPVGTAMEGKAPTSSRWAALRSFIANTMDQNPEFKLRKA
jgi:hypothetical protein